MQYRVNDWYIFGISPFFFSAQYLFVNKPRNYDTQVHLLEYKTIIYKEEKNKQNVLQIQGLSNM